MTAILSDTVKRLCLETVLADARRWYKKDYPRVFVRSKLTDKHMLTKMKRELDGLFHAQNESWDESLMDWYERMVTRYDGRPEMLPWHS